MRVTLSFYIQWLQLVSMNAITGYIIYVQTLSTSTSLRLLQPSRTSLHICASMPRASWCMCVYCTIVKVLTKREADKRSGGLHPRRTSHRGLTCGLVRTCSVNTTSYTKPFMWVNEDECEIKIYTRVHTGSYSRYKIPSLEYPLNLRDN